MREVVLDFKDQLQLSLVNAAHADEAGRAAHCEVVLEASLRAELNCGHRMLQAKLLYLPLLAEAVEADGLVPAAGQQVLLRLVEGEAGDRAQVGLVAEEQLQVSAGVDCQLPVLGDRGEVPVVEGERQPEDSVAVKGKQFDDPPLLGVPNDDAGGLAVEGCAAGGHPPGDPAPAEGLYFMWVAVELVHFGPEGVLDEVVLVGRSVVVELGLPEVLGLRLLRLLALLFFVVGGDLFPLHPLRLGHQSQHLRPSFRVRLIQQHPVLRLGHPVSVLLGLRGEEEVEVGPCEGIEVVGEAGRRLQYPDYFFVSPAGDQVDDAVLHLDDSHCVDVVAVDLRPRDLVVGVCLRIESDDSGGLVLRSADQEVATVVPLQPLDCTRVTVEALNQTKLLLPPLPHQQCARVIESCQEAMGRVCQHIEVRIFVADELPHPRLDRPGFSRCVAPQADCAVKRRGGQLQNALKLHPAKTSNAALMRGQDSLQKDRPVVENGVDILVELDFLEIAGDLPQSNVPVLARRSQQDVRLLVQSEGKLSDSVLVSRKGKSILQLCLLLRQRQLIVVYLLVCASEEEHECVCGGEEGNRLDDPVEGKADFLLESELPCIEAVMPDD